MDDLPADVAAGQPPVGVLDLTERVGRGDRHLQLARLIADGQLEVPIAATYPLGQVREAYQRLASGHSLGKIVLTV